MNKPVLTSWKATLYEIIQMCFNLSLRHIAKFNNQEQMYIREKEIECTILCKNDSLCVSLDSLPRKENDGIEWIEREQEIFGPC